MVSSNVVSQIFIRARHLWPLGLMAFAACTQTPCLSNRDYFEQDLWAPLLASNCASCHAPGGAAATLNAKLLLLPASYPNFIDTNLANVTEVAHIQYNGTSELLLKPLGQMNHGGGKVLDASSDLYSSLQTFVSRLSNPPSCAVSSSTTVLSDTSTLDALSTLRRASIQLTGQLPGADSVSRLAALRNNDAASEAVLRAELQKLTVNPNFYVRLGTIFNDTLLTNRYDRGQDAVGLLSSSDYPAVTTYFSKASSADQQTANSAVAREPLALINYVVQNDHPFTEVLTANYTMVNPWSAQVYGVTPPFNDPNDATEFQPTTLTIARNGSQIPLPHAGLLTMPTFLNRFPTTPTNRNRHRAYETLKIFLATNVLTLGTRPIDASAGAQYENPTRDNPACNVCHKILDPIAGDYQKWDDYNQDYFDPNRVWHADMQAPGYGSEIMDTADFTHSEQWLAQHIASDSRFSTAMLNIMYTGLLGQQPLDYPNDPTQLSYASKRAAWKLQDALFTQYTQNFVASKYNLKTLVVDLLMSPIYRTVEVPSYEDSFTKKSIAPTDIQAIINLGSYQFLSPELLNNKIQALVGHPWGGSNPLLLNDYRILYGGIDSDAVTARLTAPNGLMANLAMLMATQVSCQAITQDLLLPKAQRRLLVDVEIYDTPETSDGADVPTHLANIQNNIAYLHQYLLNENSAAEVAFTLDLYRQTWREGYDAVVSKQTSDYLPYGCWATKDASGNTLPDAQQIKQDTNYSIRAWMAVMTYLLSDYRFLHD